MAEEGVKSEEGEEKTARAPKSQEKQEPIGVISLIIAHFLIGAGIAVIGRRTQNKREYYGGLIFIVFIIGFYILEYLTNYIISDMIGCFRGLIVLCSWAYIIIRLFLLRNEGYEIKAI
jgi:hypothetical protein